MPHIVVADPIHPGGIERLLAAPGVTLDHPGNTTNAELKDRLSDADGLIVRGAVPRCSISPAKRWGSVPATVRASSTMASAAGPRSVAERVGDLSR